MTGTAVYEGRLEYLGWFRPWLVTNAAGSFELNSVFWEVAERLKGKPTAMPLEPDNFGLRLDPSSEYDCLFAEVGSAIIIKRREKFGFSNVTAYLSTMLCNLNGREIIAAVSDEGFTVFANPMETVPAIFRRNDDTGNSIGLNDEQVSTFCRPGTAEACIFLTASARGFECAKFADGLTRLLLDRKAEGTMRASRIGNCRCAGWEDAT